MSKLSDKHAHVLRSFRSYVSNNDTLPNISELMRLTDIKFCFTLVRILKDLEHHGEIKNGSMQRVWLAKSLEISRD